MPFHFIVLKHDLIRNVVIFSGNKRELHEDYNLAEFVMRVTYTAQCRICTAVQYS